MAWNKIKIKDLENEFFIIFSEKNCMENKQLFMTKHFQNQNTLELLGKKKCKI